MLDMGRYLAEAIYFIQYVLAQLLWTLNRSLLSIAVIVEDVNVWVTSNAAFFVDLMTNALAGPMGALFIFALTLLGVWYLLNSISPTKRFVDPQKLVLYGFMTFFFFSTPVLVIEALEGVRQAATAGVQAGALADAQGELFGTEFGGSDTGLPAAIPDVYPPGDGVIGAFDLAAYFLAIGNVAELGNTEFPALFAATYFPYGDPSSINLADEADREAAKRLAAEGLERLVFGLIAIPTAIGDHFLRLALTGVAALLYLGIPFAMMLSFFVHTEAYLGLYLRQFINLFIETFLSVIIASITIGLLALAAQRGIGLYIGASLLASVILVWRIQGAFKLAMAGMNLFGGGVITGGAAGGDLVRMGRNAAVAGAGAGLAVAVGGGALAAAGLLKADANAGGGYLGTDPEKADGRIRQLETIAGYAAGRSRTVRDGIETLHEIRTFGRNFQEGEQQAHEPDLLDYIRVGSSMSSFGSSPWVAMKLSPSLRDAYEQIGGRGRVHDLAYGDGWRYGAVRYHDEDGAPIVVNREEREQGSRGEGEPGSRGDGEMRSRGAGGQGSGGEQGQGSGGEQEQGSWGEQGQGSRGDGERLASGPADAPTRPLGGSLADAPTQPIDDSRADAPLLPRSSAPRLHIEPLTAQRQAGLGELAENLSGPAAGPTQRVLVELVGAERAEALQTAVAEHGPEAVQTAIDSVVAEVQAASAAGQSAAEIMASFQRGEGLPDSPLTTEQRTAVTDLVLQPRRAVSQADLVDNMAEMRAAGGRSDRALATLMGSPTHFGPQTGEIRAVLQGIEALQLTADELRDLAATLRSGGEAASYLTRQGYSPAAAATFSRDLNQLSGGLSILQTTAPPTATPQAAPSSGAPPEQETNGA